MRRPATSLHARAVIGLLLFLPAACGHSDPYEASPWDPLGPSSSDMPRQVTFNPGDDRSPSVSGTTVAYSRRVPGAAFDAPCLAILPAAGGTLQAEHCPPLPTPADTFVSNWLEPAVSPDGAHLAFVWRRSPRVGYLASWSQHLVVSQADSPATPLVTHSLGRLLEPGDRLVTTAIELTWTSLTTLRFLASIDSTFRMKGGGASRYTDTVTVPRALVEMDVSTGAVTTVPGGDGVVAYTMGTSGTLWVVPDTAPTQVLRLAPDGSRAAVGSWPHPVLDLAEAGGLLVATAYSYSPAEYTDSLYWLDPLAGTGGAIRLPGVGRRVAALPTGDLILEIERGFDDGFGAPANLWLLRLPGLPAVTR